MVDAVWHDDDADDVAEVGDDGAADRSAVIGDEAVGVAVDEVVALAALGAIGPRSRMTPLESMRKRTLRNVMSIPPRRPKKVERDASVCGVNSKDPNRIEFLELGDDEADGADDAGEVTTDVIGTADVVSCTNRFPIDGANC
jgi:hypothetical protein